MKSLKGKLSDASWSVDHIKQVAAFDQKFFDQPWSQKNWDESLQNGDRYFLSIMTLDGQLIAFSLYYLIYEEQLAHLLKIVVDPNHRRLAVGKRLYLQNEVALLALALDKIILDVAQGNTPALAFYSSLDFEKLHLVKHFYGKEQHAWSMQKKIRGF